MLRGNATVAEAHLSRIPARALDGEGLARAQIVRAEITLMRGLPAGTLQSLPPNSEHVPRLAPKIEQLRARAYLALEDVPGAVASLVAREQYISPSQVAKNREKIWQSLTEKKLPRGTLERLERFDNTTRGWLELALLAQNRAGPELLSQWQQRFRNHPGVRHLSAARAQGKDRTRHSSGAPDFRHGGGYALLLPLSGALKSAGIAIRDGFLNAYWAQPLPRPPIKIYDTASARSHALAAFDRAISEGAGMVIGPLMKPAVAAIAERGPSPVPVIALNYLEYSGAPAGMLQLGLAPEDEAAAAAERAAAENSQQALVLTPSTDWGHRVSLSFSERLRVMGGQLAESARYAPGTQDFGAPIKSLLNLDASHARHQGMQRALGKNVAFEPRPRGDADSLFIAAKPKDMRILLPQLAFFRGGGLPVYTTAVAYSGTVTPELEGLRFCDMPWMIDNAGRWAQARQQASVLFPEAMTLQPRLFALGGDAYRMARHWSSGGGAELNGASGQLLVGQDGLVVRRLGCARIADGRLIPLS